MPTPKRRVATDIREIGFIFPSFPRVLHTPYSL